MIQDSATQCFSPITILVPVFRNLHITRACLESLADSNLPEHASVVVINDHSPEEVLSTYCREVTVQNGFKLIVNDDNLGFVKSANIGFALYPNTDILLLNSDTVVSKNWLQRIQACAYQRPDIGTVTPFSNNGTICSYPVPPLPNPLPAHWTTAEIDIAFQLANAGTYHEIPTAVGFCMYIKRACLNETGPFDEGNFGHGYGEECDFSMRANALGWKHVVAADVFIFHEGGASFASESMARKQQADKIMHALHPKYHELVQDFLDTDPVYEFRKNVDAVRLREQPEISVDILAEHLQYTRIILERSTENRRAMLLEQHQRQFLNQLLDESRNQFANTDRALSEAQRVVENSQLYAKQLMEHIRKMEQSRSWRYTAWLRRK